MTRQDDLLRRYRDTPGVRALVELLPGGGSLNELMAHRMSEIDRERLLTLFDELALAARPLSQRTIESEDFLHSYFATVRIARRTRQRQRIRYFARLLTATFEPADHTSVDRFERYMSILEDLTYEEMELLTIVARHEAGCTSGDNPVQRTNTYWQSLTAEAASFLALPEVAVEPFLTRVSRTGLYLPITGAYLDYEGGRGLITPLYGELVALVGSRRQ